MKRKRFSEEQIIRILQQAGEGGQSIGDVCRAHGVSENTFYRWRRKFGGLSVPEARRLRELEKENSRLKRIVAERDLRRAPQELGQWKCQNLLDPRRFAMKRKRFSEEQIIRILQQAGEDGQSIGDVCRAHGVSENTFYRWRRKFGGLSVPEARRLRELEKENSRLKRIVAERDLEIDAMKELLSKKW